MIVRRRGNKVKDEIDRVCFHEYHIAKRILQTLANRYLSGAVFTHRRENILQTALPVEFAKSSGACESAVSSIVQINRGLERGKLTPSRSEVSSEFQLHVVTRSACFATKCWRAGFIYSNTY